MKYVVVKNEDIEKYLDAGEKEYLAELMDKISAGRKADEKFADNRYLVVNMDDALLTNRVMDAFRYEGIEPYDWKKANEGDLRVWYIANMGHPAVHIPVKTPEEAKALIDHLANKQLEDDRIHSNAFGLEQLGDDGDGFLEWTEWYDEETGHDIDMYMEDEDEDEDL